MPGITNWKSFVLLGSGALFYTVAHAGQFTIPGGDLKDALNAYSVQSGQPLLVSTEAVRGIHSAGAHGDLTNDAALSRLLSGTGFVAEHQPSGGVAILRSHSQSSDAGDMVRPLQLAQATPSRPAVETVTVTSSKLGGADVQSIPISITALSQEQLTATQTAGGPDLIKQVPNMSFTKTNFSGYSIQLRGIGTQAVSVTTDPAVAVAFNDIPFIRNHFFEQEFYDVSSVEVLRGPQGTLYGRNATAGVVNLSSAKPTDQFEAMASADLGNYHQRRFEGMVNIPIVDDRLDIRVAGEWTKRQGYSFNETTDERIDGRDLWSGRVTIGLKPTENLQTYLVWEHFSENDDRLRSGKQLCKTDYGPGFAAVPANQFGTAGTVNIDGTLKTVGSGFSNDGDYFTQGCAPASLYSPDSFQAPLGYTLPYILGLQDEGFGNGINPYGSETQSGNLRVIASGINPMYRAKNDTVEFNIDYAVTPTLTFTSQTGYNRDFLWSAEDYNRFGATPGLFKYSGDGVHAQGNGVQPDPSGVHVCNSPGGCLGVPYGSTCDPSVSGSQCEIAGYFCDPQVGCSNALILEDLSEEHAWQLSQEFRLASNFAGPLNFSVGGNYLHYETEENYYVFGNVLTLINGGFVPGRFDSNANVPLVHGFEFNDLTTPPRISGGYADPNPLASLNNEGHNYFLSQNPYVLNSYAMFGEVNYKLTNDLKLTGGLRWTDDQKHFVVIPSWLVEAGWGYPIAGTVNQQWDQFTGRAVVNWTPKLDFTDQTLVYGSYSHGYKAGGANPPGAIYSTTVITSNGVGGAQPTHPRTFAPEFIDAFELGTKNTLLDGALTLNGDVFYYNYTGYQISQIVDRTAINMNFNARVQGAELEANWEPVPGLKITFAGGYEGTRIDNGQSGVDLIDRTAGQSGWVVIKPFVNEASNCIFPTDVAKYMTGGSPVVGGSVSSYCAEAYILRNDPLTGLPYTPNPSVGNCANGYGCTVQAPAGYAGFDPATAPNDGTGFSKDLGGNKLPNAPPLTASFGAQYSIPLTTDWAGTLHGDYYWQDYSWARVFNDNPYDRLRGYTNVNLSLVFTNQGGWQVMLYDKNIFNTTAITGDFLNSDDSGLTTNVFLTDPKLIGVRVTKNW